MNPLKHLVGAAIALIITGYFFALLFQPEWIEEAAADSEQAREAENLRLAASSIADAPFQYPVTVDYNEGESANWWPKGQSPLLEELVSDGLLPDVHERVGSEPLVLEGPDGIGNYGGTWLRLGTSRSDVLGFASSRLAAPTPVRWSTGGYPIQAHVIRDWEHSRDYRQWTLYLRQGVRWSDGHPLTTADHLFDYQARVELSLPPNRILFAGAQEGTVEAPDRYTLVFNFPVPNPLFLEQLASEVRFFRPSHYLRNYLPRSGDPSLIEYERSKRGLPNSRTLYRELSGIGNPELPSLSPWIYPQDQRSGPWVYIRNPYFWAVDTAGNQLPYIDQIQFDERSRQLLVSSAYEGGVSMQQRHLRFDDYSLLMANRDTYGYSVYHWTDAGTPWAIWPNINRRILPNDKSSQWKADFLGNRDFRRALSLGINRLEIIDAYFAGVGEPAQPAPYPGSPYFDTELMQRFTDYDPDKANQLLDAIGLDQRDSEGFRTFPDGSRMTWYIDYGGFIDRGPTPFIVEAWRDLGLRTIERQRSAGLLNTERRALLQDFRIWDVFNIPLLEVNAFLPANGRNSTAMAYGNWFERGGMEGFEIGGDGVLVRAPEKAGPVWRAMDLYRQSLTEVNEEDRIRLFKEVMAIAADEVWAIGINTPPPVLTIVRDGFRNVATTGMSAFTFLTISNFGPETYFFDQPPPLTHSSAERLKDWIIAAVSSNVSYTADESHAGMQIQPATVTSAKDRFSWIAWAIAAGLFMSLLYAGARYPFIGRRLLVLVPTLFVMSIGIFWIIQIPPGDYIQIRIAELEAEGNVDAIEEVRELRELFHLDDSTVVQYLRWSGLYWFVSYQSKDTGLLQGNLGRSMETLQPVNNMVGDRLLLTLAISIGTILFTYAIALPIGIYSAVRQYSAGDYIFTIIGFLGLCIPNFLLALLLLYFSSQYLGIDATGLFSPEYATQPEWSPGKFIDLLKHIWIPIVVVGTAGTAGMIRVMRGNLLDELRKPYVTTARAKGVKPLPLLINYPVRLAINPFVSGIGSIFPRMVSGEAIVAIVISLPTVGPMLLQALLNQDMYMAGSLLMFLSVLGVLGTLVSDLLLMACDPRIRVEQ